MSIFKIRLEGPLGTQDTTFGGIPPVGGTFEGWFRGPSGRPRRVALVCKSIKMDGDTSIIQYEKLVKRRRK